jgi:hypothetical protein
MKMTTNSPPRWPNWLITALNTLAEQGAAREALLDFVTIAVEEVHRALKTTKCGESAVFARTLSLMVQAVYKSTRASVMPFRFLCDSLWRRHPIHLRLSPNVLQH